MGKYKVRGVDFFEQNGHEYVKIDQTGLVAIYPFDKPKTSLPVEAVLMDLDGTSIKSEEFWMSLIQKTFRVLLRDDSFSLSEEDKPYVSGFSTLEHLGYVRKKYGLSFTDEEMDHCYHRIAHQELDLIAQGKGEINQMKARPGIRHFLDQAKAAHLKLALVTSGLDYKAIPEVIALGVQAGIEEPLKYFDSIIMGGRRKGEGEYGTIGEYAAKPHPWPYLETQIALNIPKEKCIVLEDSSSGVISAVSSGINVIGFKDGNLPASGLDDRCYAMVDTFADVEKILGI